MAEKKERRYVSDNAQLMAEWDWEKNNDILPEKTTFCSGKTVWWICENGHSYQSTVARRKSGCGCPYCSGRVAIEGENDLRTLYPDIARQWNYEKNHPLLPTQVKPQSNKRVWWTCEKGHVYIDVVGSRTARGTGCPYCSNHKVLVGYNDLETMNPELAAEWHPTKNGDLKPSMVTPKGDSVVWWQCSVCGHEWKVRLNGRRGCPRCSAKRMTSFPEQAIYFYVSKIYPDAINRYKYYDYELDLFIPSQKTAIEYDGSFYHKSKRAQEKDNIKDELCKNDGIRLIRFRDPALPTTCHAEIVQCLDSYRTDEFENAIKKLFDLLDTNIAPDISLSRDWKEIEEKNRHYYAGSSISDRFPDIAKQWHYEKNQPLVPQNFTSGSSRKVWWRCDNGHEWEATISSRTNGTGCPYCSGRRIIKRKNNSFFVETAIDVELIETTPDLEKQRLYPSRYRRHKVSKDANDLLTLKPDIAKQWHYEKNQPLVPQNFTSGSSRKVWWRCDNGHEWEARISSRTNGTGCPYCSGRRIIKRKNSSFFAETAIDVELIETTPDLEKQRLYPSRYQRHKVSKDANDLLTLKPDIAAEWDYEKNAPLTPDQVTAYSNKRVWWKCAKCQHEWQSSAANRDQANCRSCNAKKAGQKTSAAAVKRNNFAEKRPDIAKQWHPAKNGTITPYDVSCGTAKHFWWVCEKGHEWQSSVANRVKDNLGCPYCGNQKVLVGYNDFPTQFPEIAKEWNYEKNVGLAPENFVSGSGKKVWWKCKNGHEWEAHIRARVRGSGCPTCNKMKSRNAKNS